MTSAPRRGERGQAIVLVAVVMVGVLLLLSLAVNVGFLFVGRLGAQQAADAAALASAVVLTQGGSSAQAVSAAVTSAAHNGYATGPSTTVTVNHPPRSGSRAGDAWSVEVVVTSSVAPLLPVFGGGPLTVSARGVGGPVRAKTTDAIVALGRGKEKALKASGNSVIRVLGGDIFINSSHSTAAEVSGNAVVTAPGHAIRVVGGVKGTNWIPAPITGAAPQIDPFGAYPKPSTAGLGAAQSCCSPTQVTISPGIYSSMKIDGPVTMLPGIYILQGGGLEVKATGSLSGTEVLLFNTTKEYPEARDDDKGECGDMKFSDGSAVLSPPSTGPYHGMVLFQDPACDKDVKLKGHASVTLTGTVYAPRAKVSVTGTADLSVSQQIVAEQVELKGTGTYTVTFDPNRSARALVPGLAE